jgi:hypothetical protein
MKITRKAFKEVCKMCRNGQSKKICLSGDCLLFGRYRACKKLLLAFCKACAPEGYKARLKCETRDGCPLEKFYNALWGKKVYPDEFDPKIAISTIIPLKKPLWEGVEMEVAL